MEVGDMRRVERAAVWARERGLRPYTFNPSPPREPGPIGPAMGVGRPLGRFGFEGTMTNDGFLPYQRVPLDVSEWEIVGLQRGGIADGGDGEPVKGSGGAGEADDTMAEAASETGDTTVSASPRSDDDAADSNTPHAILPGPASTINERASGPSSQPPRPIGNPRATSAMAGPSASRFHEHLDRDVSAPPVANFRLENRRRVERQEARDRDRLRRKIQEARDWERVTRERRQARDLDRLTMIRRRERIAGITATRVARAVGRGANALMGAGGQRAGGDRGQRTGPTEGDEDTLKPAASRYPALSAQRLFMP
ncbi:hypothetical protein LTR53_001052 [Teratosphaeriaceae sp. CCFEE 6253]|nr:hypothetical protein LTR53_001052 [Teratosphaeriaceae sp. CCFEE 6253]